MFWVTWVKTKFSSGGYYDYGGDDGDYSYGGDYGDDFDYGGDNGDGKSGSVATSANWKMTDNSKISKTRKYIPY